MSFQPFHPAGATVKIAATTVSASAALDQTSSCVRVFNAGPNICRIKFSGPSGAALAATTNDMPIAVNATEVFNKGACTFVTAICDTGTAAIEFTNGEGI